MVQIFASVNKISLSFLSLFQKEWCVLDMKPNKLSLISKGTMRKTIAAILSVCITYSLCLSPLSAQVSEPEIDEIKLDVSRLYSTTSKKVSVKMRSGAKIMGYIDAVGADTFTPRNNGNRTQVRYADVAKISRTGLSKNQKTALVIGAVAAVTVAAIVFRKKDDGGFRNPCLLC